MTSWRDVLRERQLAIEAADREELEAKEKHISLPEESVRADNSYSDVNRQSELSSTAAAAAWLLGTDTLSAQSLTLDSLQECNTSPMQERPRTYSSGVENSAADQGEAASADSGVIEVIQQSSPASADLTDDPKSDADCAGEAESLHSVGCTESDQISSSAIESLSSTPEHVISTKILATSNVLNCTSDSPETHYADDVPHPSAEAAVPVDLALDIQSPDHKRTRRHARGHGTHAEKKRSRTVLKVGTTTADDTVNLKQEVGTGFTDNCPKQSDIDLTSQVEIDTFDSQHSDEIQHFKVIPDDTVTVDLATQVVRQASYLKAVSIGSENTVTSQQQSDSTDVTESTVVQASKDHLSSHESGKTGSNSSAKAEVRFLVH